MELVFATHNENKVKEIQELVPPSIKLLSLADLNFHTPIAETGSTLPENALIKAEYVWNHFKLSCFADDTGLEVDALDGAPGVRSARYAGEECSSADNINLLLKSLSKYENRSARFRTAIHLILEGIPHTFSGEVWGKITENQIGQEGFGYDPVFLPNGYESTFAEMPLSEKNKISHRGKAFKKLISFLHKSEL